ncbi:MAG: VOC family protein [Chloroflexota bacterium]|nr:VOC family protein [Chloroflexota bacterium]
MSDFLHVSLRSRDRDQTSEWYQKNLGFEERRRGTTGIGTQTAILELPGNKTYIEVSDRSKLGRDFEIPDEAIALQFTVDDLKAAHQRLQQNGTKIIAGNPDEGYLLVQDVDGYEVEITAGEAGTFSSFGIRVHDLDESAKFYVQHFGFRETRRGTSPRGEQIVELELPGNVTTLTLRQAPASSGPLGIPENLMHMAFPVPDMNRFREEMKQKGVGVDPDGDRMSWVLDPDGYELEMIERRQG